MPRAVHLQLGFPLAPTFGFSLDSSLSVSLHQHVRACIRILADRPAPGCIPQPQDPLHNQRPRQGPGASPLTAVLLTRCARRQVYRAAQNLARIIAYLFLVRGNAVSAARWTALKAHLALGRKRACSWLCRCVHAAETHAVLQLGKPLEHLQAALRAYQTAGLASSGEQAMLVLRQLCYFGYLTYDALVWVRRASLSLC
jgi:hypothetical protein